MAQVKERLLGFRPHGLGPAEHHQRDTEGERFGLVNGLGGFGTGGCAECRWSRIGVCSQVEGLIPKVHALQEALSEVISGLSTVPVATRD